MTLSTSDVARVLRPNVVMRLELTDGTVRVFEVSLAEFHQLRHSVVRGALETRLRCASAKGKTREEMLDDLLREREHHENRRARARAHTHTHTHTRTTRASTCIFQF